LLTSKIEKRNEFNHSKGTNSPRISRLFDQCRKKLPSTRKTSRVPGVSIQHQNDANISPDNKDKQFVEENQTDIVSSSEDMQMDSRSTWENDVYDSSCRRSTTSYPTYTARFIEGSEQYKTELGNKLQIIQAKPARITLVAEQHNPEKWTTDSNNTIEKNKDGYICRRLQYRLGNQLAHDQHIRILDEGRDTTIHKRKRASNDFICPEMPWTKSRRLNLEDFFGQYYCNKIRDKSRRYQLTPTSRSSHRNSRRLQLSQYQSSIPTRTRYTKYRSRPSEPAKETIIRGYNSETIFSTNTAILGPNEDRRVRSETQSPAQTILEPKTRSISSSSRCISTAMVDEGNVSVPTLETNTTSNTEDKTAKIETSSVSDTVVAHTILVSSDSKDETPTATTNMENQQEMVSNRLAIINNYRQKHGIKSTTL
jgi:hypothetical protein